MYLFAYLDGRRTAMIRLCSSTIESPLVIIWLMGRWKCLRKSVGQELVIFWWRAWNMKAYSAVPLDTISMANRSVKWKNTSWNNFLICLGELLSSHRNWFKYGHKIWRIGVSVSLVVEWQIPILLARVRFPDGE